MRDLTRLASRIVMFFMQFYYRLAHHSRVSYKAYINGRTCLEGYNTIQDNVLLAGAREEVRTNKTLRSVLVKVYKVVVIVLGGLMEQNVRLMFFTKFL